MFWEVFPLIIFAVAALLMRFPSGIRPPARKGRGYVPWGHHRLC